MALIGPQRFLNPGLYRNSQTGQPLGDTGPRMIPVADRMRFNQFDQQGGQYGQGTYQTPGYNPQGPYVGPRGLSKAIEDEAFGRGAYGGQQVDRQNYYNKFGFDQMAFNPFDPNRNNQSNNNPFSIFQRKNNQEAQNPLIGQYDDEALREQFPNAFPQQEQQQVQQQGPPLRPGTPQAAYQQQGAQQTFRQRLGLPPQTSFSPNLPTVTRNRGAAVYNTTRNQTPLGGTTRQRRAGQQGGFGAGQAKGSRQRRSRGMLNDLFDQFQQTRERANYENEKRYQQLIGGLENRYNRAIGLSQGLGDQSRRDINQQFRELSARQQSDLTSRGLSGSSTLGVMQQGVFRQRTDAQGRLNEQLRRERIGLDTTLSKDLLDAIERRTDEGPDFNQLIKLAEAAGKSRTFNGVGRSQQPFFGGGGYGGGFGGFGGGFGNQGFVNQGQGGYFGAGGLYNLNPGAFLPQLGGQQRSQRQGGFKRSTASKKTQTARRARTLNKRAVRRDIASAFAFGR